ncbi:MAG: RimK/LysX family protein [Lysobacteraceae bacterium]
MVERGRQSKPVLGWREWLALPDFGIHAIRAKIDTGARSSALHVETLETFQSGGREWVRFSVATGPAGAKPVLVESTVHDRRPVTDSGGHVSERIFLRTRLLLAGESYPVEINLTSRRNMLFPMLLGRTALARHFLVDPTRSFRAGRLPHESVACP